MLYLVRHGTTTFNSRAESQETSERIRGWLPVPLDDHGKQQAIRAGLALQEYNISKIYSSPLIRAQETAQEISLLNHGSIEIRNGLTPWNLGDVNGMMLNDAIPIMSRAFENGECLPNGESYLDFYERWKLELKKLLEESKTTNICAVTHSRNLYCLEHILTDGKSPIVFTGLPIPGGIIEINPDLLSSKLIH